MAKQPFQLAKIHLVAVVRRLAKGILQQFSTIKRDYFGEGAIVWPCTTTPSHGCVNICTKSANLVRRLPRCIPIPVLT